MRMVVIEPVDKPKSFEDVKFSQAQWDKAVKTGPLLVPYGTARENMKLSGGMYRIRPDESNVVEVKMKGVKSVEDMDGAELAAEMAAWGKPPRKAMTKTKAREFVLELREAGAKMVVDD